MMLNLSRFGFLALDFLGIFSTVLESISTKFCCSSFSLTLLKLGVEYFIALGIIVVVSCDVVGFVVVA